MTQALQGTEDLAPQSRLRVLLVDDDEPFRMAMAKALRRRGFSVSQLADGAAAVSALAALAPDQPDAPQVVVLDLRMPGLNGLDVLRQTPGRTVPVVVLTGHGTIPDAVEAMRLGAYTFLMKPVDGDSLAPVLKQAAAQDGGGVELVGQSATTEQLRGLLTRLAGAEEPVLLTGETGTGKEVAARFLHQQSPRVAQPFVAINMACLPKDLIESELFGHAKGAFTGAERRKVGLFEEVGEGTLFLDEVAELPIEHQAKLLRVLEARSFRPVGETREVPFKGRLIAATHQRLAEEVRAGRFREDLYYRLQVLPLELPALRSRRDDIVPIMRHWLARVSRDPLNLTEDAEAVLLQHPWPGNVRELVNLARRVALFATDGEVTAPLVQRMLAANPFGSVMSLSAPPAPAPQEGARVEEISLEAVERRHIERLLAHHKNITKVARILDINRRTLQRKLKAWGVEHEDFAGDHL